MRNRKRTVKSPSPLVLLEGEFHAGPPRASIDGISIRIRELLVKDVVHTCIKVRVPIKILGNDKVCCTVGIVLSFTA